MLLDQLLGNLGVQFESFDVMAVPAGGTVAMPPQPRTSVHFVLGGEGVVRTPGTKHVLLPSYLSVVPTEVPHSLVGGEGALTLGSGRIDVRYGDGPDVFGALADALVIDMGADAQMRSAMTGLLAERTSPQAGGAAMQRALLDQCLVSIFRAVCNDPACDAPWLQALEEPALGPAIATILDDPGRPHTVDSLAETSHLSRAAFARRFSDAFGMPPMTYVREVRLREAARRLATQQSVGSVARAVGYSSRSQFTRAFSARFEVSPTDYRAGGQSHPTEIQGALGPRIGWPARPAGPDHA